MLIAPPYLIHHRRDGMLRVLPLRLVPLAAVSPIRFEGASK